MLAVHSVKAIQAVKALQEVPDVQAAQVVCALVQACDPGKRIQHNSLTVQAVKAIQAF